MFIKTILLVKCNECWFDTKPSIGYLSGTIWEANLLLSFCLCELVSVLIAHIFICFFSEESFTLVKSFAPEYSVLLQVAEILTFKRFISNFFVYVYNRFVFSKCVILLPEKTLFITYVFIVVL